MDAEQAKTEELAAVIREIKDRVRARHPAGTLETGHIAIPDLTALLHARDAAEAKVAAIGTVNPRRGGVLNSIVQGAKKLVARMLDWHVREQVEFNRAVISCIQSTLDIFDEQNRAMSQLAGYFHAQVAELRALGLEDMRTHWAQWRAGWEERQNRSEVYMLRTISELNAAFQHRSTLTESEFRQAMREQHGNYTQALENAGRDIQLRLWADLARMRTEYEQLIHAELRTLRQRGAAAQAVAMPATSFVPHQDVPQLDWLRFAERFRGTEQHVRDAQSLYIERFAGASDVLDIGCGRGEFLGAAKAAGIGARGIDLSAECVQLCLSKGLEAETADLFEYLANQPDESLGGIYCSQVIEHLPPARLPELVRLAGAKLRRGALAAFETPNPECLAIFGTYFYVDPTHTRPVPAMLMAFYLEEAGLGAVDIVRLSPAAAVIPQIGELPEAVREALFGGMDYAIFAKKL